MAWRTSKSKSTIVKSDFDIVAIITSLGVWCFVGNYNGGNGSWADEDAENKKSIVFVDGFIIVTFGISSAMVWSNSMYKF